MHMVFRTLRKTLFNPWFTAIFLVAASISPPARAESSAEAVVSFTLDFPGSEPSHYVISVASDGHGTYESNGKLSNEADDETFRLEFVFSPAVRSRIFDLAKKAKYFQGELDSKKRGLASTGMKTLAYKSGSTANQGAYNYSTLPAVQQLTALFQNLSTTLEYGRRLDYFRRYQKLALDEELKRMEESSKNGNIEELSAVVPTLRQIVGDTSVMNVTRARARRLIALAGTH